MSIISHTYDKLTFYECINNELHRIPQYLADLGPLAEVLAPSDNKSHSLVGSQAYYYCQAEIRGETLLSVLSKTSWNAVAQANLDSILSLEMRCYDRLSSEPFAQMGPLEMFNLLAIDLGRASQSLQFLKEVAGCAEKLDQWPSDVPSATTITKTVSSVIENWESLLRSQDTVLTVGQHGDLNPGNVIIPEQGKVVLIDFSRLGRWPVGYDIARLSSMLRIRLTDHKQHRDWAENRLKIWVKDVFCSIEVELNPATTQCPWATYCDQQFRNFLNHRKPNEQQTMVRGYKLGMLWDYIKVLSYGDLSPFKRLLALIACWRLSISLGFTK